MGASISANHGSHCFINSKTGDSHPTHNSNPTRTHTYIHSPPPLPAGPLTAPHGHTISYWLCHFPAPNPTRYKYPAQSCHWHTSFTCLWRWNRQWVPKRRQLELGRPGNYPKRNKLQQYRCLLSTRMFNIDYCLDIFRTSLCPLSGEKKPRITAYGVIFW